MCLNQKNTVSPLISCCLFCNLNQNRSQQKGDSLVSFMFTSCTRVQQTVKLAIWVQFPGTARYPTGTSGLSVSLKHNNNPGVRA